MIIIEVCSIIFRSITLCLCRSILVLYHWSLRRYYKNPKSFNGVFGGGGRAPPVRSHRRGPRSCAHGLLRSVNGETGDGNISLSVRVCACEAVSHSGPRPSVILQRRERFHCHELLVRRLEAQDSHCCHLPATGMQCLQELPLIEYCFLCLLPFPGTPECNRV